MIKSLLVADDEPVILKLIEESLKSNDFQIATASNGKEAFDAFIKNPFKVVITDIEMPEINGYELIEKIRDAGFDPVFFVISGNDRPSTIIDMMKTGIFDYIIKPINVQELLLKINRAFDHYDMKKAREILDKEKVIRLEQQLEWYKWEDRIKSRNTSSIKDNLFHSLKTSFNQGAGFGSMVTLINVITSTAKEENGQYLIDRDLFNIIKENAAMSDKALNTFSEISDIVTADITLEQTSAKELYGLLKTSVDELKVFSDLNGHTILISDDKNLSTNTLFRISKNYFKQALTELIMNALKFSKKETQIILLFSATKSTLSMSVINTPAKDDKDRIGIPMEYENIVFEPFFRMNKSIKEEYKTLDYGLGLTAVEKIVGKHGGRVSISNVTDYSDIKAGPSIKVSATITIPAEVK